MTDQVQLLAIVGGLGIVGAALYVFLTKQKREKKQAALHPTEFQKYKLIQREDLTTGVLCPVSRFRFKLQSDDHELGLPTGQHISLQCINPETGKPHLRSYTPISSNDEKGYFDLVIKIYPTGVMGQHLNKMKIGDCIEARGPKGKFTYKQNDFTHLCMLAGGSGITPMYQIMQAVVKGKATDRTRCHLLYGNITEEDIILRKELTDLCNVHTDTVNCYHVLNTPPQDWSQGSGFITKDLIASKFPAPSDARLRVLLCGPPPMITAMKKVLAEIGYSDEQVFCF